MAEQPNQSEQIPPSSEPIQLVDTRTPEDRLKKVGMVYPEAMKKNRVTVGLMVKEEIVKPDKSIVVVDTPLQVHPEMIKDTRLLTTNPDVQIALERVHLLLDDTLSADERLKKLAEISGHTQKSCYEKLIQYVAHELLQEKGPRIGIAGFAADNNSYEEEVRAVKMLFSLLQNSDVPKPTIVNGGTNTGVPGIAAYEAKQEYGFKTEGCVPALAAKSLVEEDTTVIMGDVYGDESPYIGITSDVIVFFGGGRITIEEYKAALAAGTKIFLCFAKEISDPEIITLQKEYLKIAGTEDAIKKGQIVVCTDQDKLKEAFGDMINQGMEQFYEKREGKISQVTDYLNERNSTPSKVIPIERYIDLENRPQPKV